MMRRVKKSMVYLIMSIIVIFSACSTAANSENEALETLAPETEITITSSKLQVKEFISRNKDFKFGYDEDECFNITPGFIADNSEFAIFKYNKSTESFIMYDGDVYSIGTCFGGHGITSMALADLNKDNQYELYYTFSRGSGIPQSQIGYFDPVNKEVIVFDYSKKMSEMMLTVNESGDLCVNSAVPDFDTCVDFSMKAQNLIGTIIYEKDKVTLNMF